MFFLIEKHLQSCYKIQIDTTLFWIGYVYQFYYSLKINYKTMIKLISMLF